MRNRTVALRVSLTYGIVAASYILVSDWAASRYVVGEAGQAIQTYKGLAFVAVTTLLVFTLFRRALRLQEVEAERRRRAVAASAALDRRNDSFLRALGEIVYDHDVVADHIEWSGNSASVGWKLDELGQDIEWWLNLIHPDDRRQVRSEFEKPADLFVVDYRIRHRDGHYVWMFDRGVKTHDARGDLTHVTGVMWDITERKLAEQALRDSEARFRQLAENINEVFWLTDVATGVMLYVGPGYARIWGQSVESLLETPAAWIDAIHPEDRGRVRKDAYMRQPVGTYDVEYRIIRPDGEVRWIHDRAFPIRDEAGVVYRIAGVAEDITPRKANEEAIQQRLGLEQRLSRFAVSAPGVLYTFRLGPDGRMSMPYCSPEMERLTGLAPPTLAENVEPLFKLVHPADLARLIASIHESARSMSPWQTEFRVGTDPEIWIEGRSAPVREGDCLLWYGFLSDITDRKLLEDQLRQAQKMEAVGQLAGGIAHDFNNLLTVIVGYSDLLLGSLPDDHPDRSAVEEIRKAGDRSAALTRQLLAFSRKQVLAPQVLDVNEIVRQTDRLLRRLIGEDVQLTVALAADVGLVRADPGQLEQAILNLVVNARDAMPDGGSLVLTTSREEMMHAGVSSKSGDPAPGRYVRLSVADSGVGIGEAVKPRLFEPFFTTKPTGHGTGLGLAVVHGFVKQTGGWIDVDSEEGAGATFHIYLPSLDQEPAGAASVVPADQEMPSGRETILLVEDEDPLRLLASRVLGACGYEVLVAANGPEALQACERPGMTLDLLVTDVVMPEVGGPALARRIAERHPGVRVLFVSGYTTDTVVRSGIEDGQVEFLQKPFAPVDLARKVRAVLDGPRHVQTRQEGDDDLAC